MYGSATQTGASAAKQAVSAPPNARRVRPLRAGRPQAGANRCRDVSRRRRPVHSEERQRRVSHEKGDQEMNRTSYQQGYVSDPTRTRNGLKFVIRYRVRTSEGKWRHKAETLYGLGGKKAAQAI